MHLDNIPGELKAGKHHCAWKPIKDEKTGKINKVPFDPVEIAGYGWGSLRKVTFQEAIKLCEDYNMGGIGYLLNEDPGLVCIDLDKCIVNGAITPAALAIVKQFNSYTEYSPSGQGLHIWVKAQIKGGSTEQVIVDGQAVEIFTHKHHVTLTGHVFEGFTTLESRQDEADNLYMKVKARTVSTAARTSLSDPAKVAYCKKVLEDEAQTVANTPEGNRNPQLNISAGKVASLFNTGYMDESEARSTLRSAASRAGLPSREAEATIQSGFEYGKDHPRDIPDTTRSIEIRREPVLPMIVMSGQQLRDVSDEALKALVKAQADDPHIFERGGKLCRIRFDENGACVISSMVKDEEFRGVLARVADYYIITSKGDEIPKPPSMDVVKDILYAMSRWDGIKPLLITVDSPVLRADGSILSERGYDEASRLYYSTTAPIDLVLPEFGQQAAKDAIKWLTDEVLVDFPFVDDASRANALAALITPTLRPTIAGCVPFYVVDKPTPGCGASLLVETICLINTGQNAEMGGKAHDDEEMGKNITAILRKGPRIAVLDNMTGVFGYTNFSRMLTSRIWADRLLGKNESLSLPNLTCWMGTANNVKFGGDIGRRKYTSRIDPQMARPQDRTGFKHPDLKEWVLENRSEILSKILTVCASWFAAGKPKSSVKPIGSFEEWTAILSGVLEYAGVIGFMDNRTNTDLDVDDTELADFFACWYDVHKDNPVSADVIFNELTAVPTIAEAFQRAMPSELADKLKGPRLSANPIRYFLRKYRDRIFSNGLRLMGTAPKTKHDIAKWKVTSTFQPLIYHDSAQITPSEAVAGG